MAWGTSETSTALTLTSSWQTVQRSAADWEITLNPKETANVLLTYNPQASPTDTLEVAITKSPDQGTEWESDEYAFPISMGNTPDPGKIQIEVTGCRTFRIRARLTGATDTTSTLTVEVEKDGVSV